MSKRSIARRKQQILTIQTSEEVIAKSTEFPIRTRTSFKEYFRRATKDDLMYNGSFHEAVAPVLILAQCFALLPVKGVKSKDVMGLSFSWKYLPTIYSAIIFVSLTIFFSLNLNIIFKHQFSLAKIDPLVFYGSSVYAYFLFGRLARKWPELMRKWNDVESILPEYQSQNEKAVLANRIKMITFTITMLSLSEHVLNIISIIHSANYCDSEKNPIKSFFAMQLPEIFTITSFVAWKAVLGKILNILATFVWNFMDVFVMVVSVGLAEKFRQVNESIFRFKGKNTSETFWREHRKYYQNLCTLCDDVDNEMSLITMISFSNNLYFICVQLLKSLNESPSFAHYFYFWFSLIYLIGRTLAVSLYSAEINDESKRPNEVLRLVPKESWCLEVKRFSAEVNGPVVALSGMKFFFITRQFVLSVAGTIITYELVLIQFQVAEKVSGC